MDFTNLRDQVSNLSLYDIKAGVRKVQNAVMNYTEMEAKVREATNNEPWGASSTLMQEIANATYSYQLLNEVMPMIYKRFTEKAAEEWRQIYKALQLLEFLVKNGSERVIDDARSHLSLLKMLRQFQYIDLNGKDQGINVRNRAKELADLLSDVERIRSERKKSRSNRNKFSGIEGGSNPSSGFSGGAGGSRYGGFSSEDAQFGGFSGGVYGDGGGFGGQERSTFSDTSNRRDKFEEYDEGDASGHTGGGSSSSRHSRHNASTSSRRKAEPPKPKAPEVDLFEFGDDDIPPAAPPKPTSTASGKQPAADLTAGDDDDFDDFISATPEPAAGIGAPPPMSNSSISPPPQATHSISQSTQFAQPTPVPLGGGPNISGIMSTMSPTPPTGSQSSGFAPPPGMGQVMSPTSTMQSGGMGGGAARPTGYQAPTPNYFTSVQMQQGAAAGGAAAGVKPGMTSTPSFGAAGAPQAAAKPAAKAGGDAFGSLWATASTTAGIKKNAPAQGPNLASLAKEKTSAGIWGPAGGAHPGGQQAFGGAAKPAASQQQQQSAGGGFDDLLG